MVQNTDVVPPRNLCNNLLHELPVGPCFSESSHVFEVSWREPRHLGKRTPQISGQSIYYFGSPAVLRLPCQDVRSNAPIEQDKFAVYS